MFSFLVGLFIGGLSPQPTYINNRVISNVKVTYESIPNCKLYRVYYNNINAYVVGNKYVFKQFNHIEKTTNRKIKDSISDYSTYKYKEEMKCYKKYRYANQHEKCISEIYKKASELVPTYYIVFKKDTLSYVQCNLIDLKKTEHVDLSHLEYNKSQSTYKK